MTNPHPSQPATKLVSQEALLRYHHTLLEKLGLVQDTAEYKYNGERTDFPETVKSVSTALDKLYDMAKEGALEFSSGKSEEATKEVTFDSEDGESSNLYWINAKVGDETVNIKLDADAFVKDSVLDSVVLVNLSTVEGEKVYKVNGTVANYTAATETAPSELKVGDKTYYGFAETVDGTYFHYTWRVDQGEKGTGYTFTTISLKDIYGDLTGDDYITYDKENAQIKAQTADVVKNEIEAVKLISDQFDNDQATNYYDNTVLELQKDGIDHLGKVAIVPDGDGKSHLEVNYINDDEEGNSSDGFATAGVENDGGQYIYFTKETDKENLAKWEVDSTDETNLATAENLANVAQDLQEQIDSIDSKNKATATVNSEEPSDDNLINLTVTQTAAGTNYNIAYNVVSDDDIDGMFSICGGAESIAETSAVNGGAAIEAAGTYDINVGEEPEGAVTDITWTQN